MLLPAFMCFMQLLEVVFSGSLQIVSSPSFIIDVLQTSVCSGPLIRFNPTSREKAHTHAFLAGLGEIFGRPLGCFGDYFLRFGEVVVKCLGGFGDYFDKFLRRFLRCSWRENKPLEERSLDNKGSLKTYTVHISDSPAFFRVELYSMWEL